jgi:hypothetical protein
MEQMIFADETITDSEARSTPSGKPLSAKQQRLAKAAPRLEREARAFMARQDRAGLEAGGNASEYARARGGPRRQARSSVLAGHSADVVCFRCRHGFTNCSTAVEEGNMDDQRFDAVVKRVATRSSRRGVIGGLLAAGAGALAARTVGAAGKSACAKECQATFPEAKKGVRRGCVSACVAATESTGQNACPAACKAEFPEAKKGVRRGCVSACVQAAKAAE